MNHWIQIYVEKEKVFKIATSKRDKDINILFRISGKHFLSPAFLIVLKDATKGLLSAELSVFVTMITIQMVEGQVIVYFLMPIPLVNMHQIAHGMFMKLSMLEVFNAKTMPLLVVQLEVSLAVVIMMVLLEVTEEVVIMVVLLEIILVLLEVSLEEVRT